MDPNPTQTLPTLTDVRPQGPCLDLDLLADRAALRTIRVVAMSFLRAQYGDLFPQVWLEELVLVLQEACTNVVRHAYRDRSEPGPVQIQILARADLIRIQVWDEGPGFEFSEAIPPDFQRPRDGGYGLHLLQQIMSRVEYHRDSSRNVLILEKALVCPVQGATP